MIRVEGGEEVMGWGEELCILPNPFRVKIYRHVKYCPRRVLHRRTFCSFSVDGT